MHSPLVNHARIRTENISANHLVYLVSLENVHIGLRVQRGVHWRASWKDDMDKADITVPNVAKRRLGGIIIGYTNNKNMLVGRNSERKYDHDKIKHNTGPGWAVVKWDNNKKCIYPIGAENLYSLKIEI